jgi:flagellar motor protein MotB
LCAAILFSGCVSVGEYGQVKGQLELEQGRAIEREKRSRELEVLAENLRRRLEVAELERGEARERLHAASRALALKPPDAAARRPPTTSARAAPSEGSLVATIRFVAGSASVSDKGRNDIARIARGLAGKGRMDILVCGHSDPTPIERSQERYLSNMHLSAARALAVYHEFVARPGVDAARVAVVAWGQHRPVAGDADGLRRVEIRVRPAAKSSTVRHTRSARPAVRTPRPTVRKRPTTPKAAPRPPVRPKPLARPVPPREAGVKPTAPVKPRTVTPRPPAERPKAPAPAPKPAKKAPPPGGEPEPWR